jgi:methylated-DNA-protein-cysteine methyltransferase-like protein
MSAAGGSAANGEFQAVYDYVRTVPRGRVVSYGDVGAAVGVTARTVGWAMSLAPEDVPWQRVVGADGYLRIAKRSPELRQLQRTLLEAEGVAFDERGHVRMDAHHWPGPSEECRFFLDAPEATAEIQPAQSALPL